jgi:hypothetical protein
MKTLLVRLQFKLASWLYNQGIIAPQLLGHSDGTPVRNIKILTPDESENIDMVMKDFYGLSN